MKKLSLVLVMVFAVCMVMAQKTTWVTQEGTSNLANVTQSACRSGDATSIYATQLGSWNTLNTDQTGNNNYIELFQGGTSNSATMEQFSCDAIELPGGKNTALITQNGVSGTASLTQKEDNVNGADYSNNKATATQSGSNNSYVLNQGFPINAGTIWQPINTSYLQQNGVGNTAYLNQAGLTDWSQVIQDGNWNTANLVQRGTSAYGLVTSLSTQLGVRNMLNIHQDGGATELAESVQNGNANTTNIEQVSWDVQNVVSQQKGTNDIINVSQSN